MQKLAVMYGKAVDDKEIGIYLEDVYFGGIATTPEEADVLARECVNNIRGGTAIIKIIPVNGKNALLELFDDAKSRFDKIEIMEIKDREGMLEAVNKLIDFYGMHKLNKVPPSYFKTFDKNCPLCIYAEVIEKEDDEAPECSPCPWMMFNNIRCADAFFDETTAADRLNRLYNWKHIIEGGDK